MEIVMDRFDVKPQTPLDPPALPPPGFDPIRNPADRARLEEFWLPSMPDPDHEAELYEHWKEMFSEPLRFVWAKSQPFFVNPFETSPNWSGAYVLPENALRYTRVTGRWEVPQVSVGTGPNPYSLPYRCSIWIGLDGKKRWTRSMPQVGTAHTIQLDGTVEDPTFWWQWWLRDGISEPHNISGVPIAVGDVVLCNLTAVSPTFVRFHVKNRNTGSFATIGVFEPHSLLGSSAEWIIERPANPAGPSVSSAMGAPNHGPLFPLPDYGVVTFTRCATRAELEPGTGVQHGLPWEPRLIRMVQTFPQPTRSEVISMPTRRGQAPRAVRLAYRRPL